MVFIKNLLYILGFFLFLMCCSCEKPAGEGGLGSITGKVFVREYNSNGIFKNEYFAPDEKVYIIYGENQIYDDETSTHFDGTYRFNYLHKGDYTIFVYSECDTCSAPDIAIQEKVTILGRGNETSVPLIVITK